MKTPPTPRVGCTVKFEKDIAKIILLLSREEARTFPNMVVALVLEALKERKREAQQRIADREFRRQIEAKVLKLNLEDAAILQKVTEDLPPPKPPPPPKPARPTPKPTDPFTVPIVLPQVPPSILKKKPKA